MGPDDRTQSNGDAAGATPPAKGDAKATPQEPTGKASVDASLEVQLADLRDKWLRARADYENLQRRTVRDAAAEQERARARVLEAFLPVFELAQIAAHQAELHPGPVSEGVVLMAREFARMLEREGLVAVGKAGEAFDPRIHEAVGQEEAAGLAPGAVARVVLPGYRLGDRVLRFAKVLVAAPAPKE